MDCPLMTPWPTPLRDTPTFPWRGVDAPPRAGLAQPRGSPHQLAGWHCFFSAAVGREVSVVVAVGSGTFASRATGAPRPPPAKRALPARRARCRERRFRDGCDVLRVPFRTLNLNPPMLFPGVCPPARLGGRGPAGGARVAGGVSCVWACEGRFRDVACCLEGALQGVERPMGALQGIAAVPQAPLAACHPQGGRRALRARRPRSGLCPPAGRVAAKGAFGTAAMS
jgi:hypothetical protein